MARVTGRVYPSPAAPATARTRTMASGPYATEAIASRESAASPWVAVRRCRSPEMIRGEGGAVVFPAGPEDLGRTVIVTGTSGGGTLIVRAAQGEGSPSVGVRF